MALAGNSVGAFGTKVEGVDQSVAGLSRRMKLGLAAAGTAVVAGFAFAIREAGKFDAAMRNVQSITKETDASLEALKQQVLDLSAGTTQSAETLANALYEINSSGFAGAEALQVLEASATAAQAGITDADVAVGAITATLNAYGLAGSEAADVSDVLFKTVDLGVVTFEELAGNLGDVVGLAATARVDIGEVGAAISAMTLVGVPAAQSTTSLARTIQALIDPSEELATLYGEIGIESGAMALEQDGLYSVMERIREVTGGNVEELLALFPEIRAARGAFALMANDGGNYASTMAGIADENARAGASQAAFNEQMKAASRQFGVLVNNIRVGAIKVGEAFLPVLIAGMERLQDAGSAAAEALKPIFDALSTAAGAFGRALDHTAEVLGSLGQAVFPFIQAVIAIGGGILVAGLTAVATAFEQIAKFLNENKVLVETLAKVIGTVLVAKMLLASKTALIWLGNMVVTRATTGMLTLAGAVENIIVGMRRAEGGAAKMRLAFRSIAPAAGLLGAGLAIGALFQGLRNAESKAQDVISSLKENYDLDTTEGLLGYANELDKKLDSAATRADEIGRGGSFTEKLGATVKGTFELLTPAENTVIDDLKLEDDLREESERLKEIIDDTLLTAQAAGIKIAEALFERPVGVSFADDLEDPQLRTIMGELVILAEDLGIEMDGSESSVAELVNQYTLLKSGDAITQDITDAMGDLADETESASDKLETYLDLMDELINKDKNVVDAQIGVREATRDVLEGVEGEEGTLELFTETEGADANLSNLSGLVDAYVEDAQRIAEQTGDTDAGIESLIASRDELQGILTETFGLETPELLIGALGLGEENLDTLLAGSTEEGAQQELDELLETAEALAEDEFEVMTDVETEDALAAVSELETALDDLVDNLYTVDVEVTRSGFDPGTGVGEGAGGGGGSTGSGGGRNEQGRKEGSWAQGGINEDINGSAFIAGAGTPIRFMFNEPGTGGEAFIPLSVNKRGRSLAILNEVAQRFGQQVGPVQTFAHGGINRAMPVSTGPVQHVQEHHYHFGDIQGVRMEDAVRYARAQQRREQLTRG